MTRKQTIRSAVAAAALCLVAGAAHAQGAGVGNPPADVKHYDPNGKEPSTFTLEVRKGVAAKLPFSDKRVILADKAAHLVEASGIPRLGDQLGPGQDGVVLDVPQHRGIG